LHGLGSTKTDKGGLVPPASKKERRKKDNGESDDEFFDAKERITEGKWRGGEEEYWQR
jgi:hypothetical protein